MKSLTLILCLQTLLIMISIIPTSHSKIFQPNDETVILFTCSKTPYPNLCASSLLFSPKGPFADVRGCAQVMIDFVMKLRANFALDKIRELQRAGNKPGLDSCAKHYNTILAIDIPKASVAYDKSKFDLAINAVNAAAKEASSCEAAFPGKLTEENKFMSQVSANAAAIIKYVKSGQ